MKDLQVSCDEAARSVHREFQAARTIVEQWEPGPCPPPPGRPLTAQQAAWFSAYQADQIEPDFRWGDDPGLRLHRNWFR